MQRVTFKARDDLNNVLASDKASKTMLTEYFIANRLHPWAQDIMYKDYPGSFIWQKRKNRCFQVGRIVSANPAEGERYFLRVLLNHIAGSQSFEDLKTVDGVLYDSFRLAAERRGLIQIEQNWAMSRHTDTYSCKFL
jgi:ATP-dependent DNA helicase PIF1